MIYSRDFYISSILPNSTLNYMIPFKIEEWAELSEFCIDAVFEKLPGQTELFIQLINHLKGKRYPEARKILGMRSDYSNLYSEDIANLRYNIKFLLSGLITTSAIKTYRFYNYAIMPFDDGIYSYGTSEYYNPVALEYNKVTDMKMMDDFNEYFRNYLIGMAFRISEIYIKRMAYTIQYLQDENLFPDKCQTAMVGLDKFKLQLEALR